MKIKKFKINESFSISWTKEKFEKINEMKAEISNLEENIKPFLHDFLELNKELLDSNNINANEFYIKYFKYYPEHPYTPFEIDCRNDYNDRYYVELNHKKFNELLYFLKDPEMYKNTKKFNL